MMMMMEKWNDNWKNSKELSRVYHPFSFTLKVEWVAVVDINNTVWFGILIKSDYEYYTIIVFFYFSTPTMNLIS